MGPMGAQGGDGGAWGRIAVHGGVCWCMSAWCMHGGHGGAWGRMMVHECMGVIDILPVDWLPQTAIYQ